MAFAPGDIDKLVPLKKALLNREVYLNMSAGIVQFQEYCQFAMIPAKALEWCEHLGCTEDVVCVQGTLPPSLQLMPMLNVTTTAAVPTTTIFTLENVGYNDTCYDAHLCYPAWFSFIHHIVLGWVSLFLCIFGVLGHTLCIPAFNVASIRSGTTLYLTGIAVVDILYLILNTIIVVSMNLPPAYLDQLRFYGRFCSYLIPFGVPTMELCELLMTWFMVALLLDRYYYLKYGYQSKSICSRSLSAKVMIGFFIFLSIYTVPKLLKYHVVEDKLTGLARVQLTKLGGNLTYTNLMTHWLKVPIEMFLPNLAICIISVIITFKMIDTHSIRQKKFNVSLAAGMSPRQIIEHRENAIATISICLGIFLLLARMPKFILHVILTEGYILRRNLVIFELSNQFLSIVFAFCKPLFCLYIGYHFKRALVALCCCRDVPSELVYEMKLLDEKNQDQNPVIHVVGPEQPLVA